MELEKGSLIRLPGEDSFVTHVMSDTGGPLATLVVQDDAGMRTVTLNPAKLSQIQMLTADGQASSERLLAGLWAEWMGSAAATVDGAAMVSSSLTPYPHQHQAVYQRMLPQPMLRFLLGDEPGTGKTIMGGLYAREAQRLGMVNRCLIVCPAHLVTKWQSDFERFLGGGLHRITNDTIKHGALEAGLHDGDGFWVVSLELAAMNPAVLEAIHPDTAGWDLVIFDEAHRLTPTAESFHRVGRVLTETPRAVFMTATPHRGNEWYFRSLMHLVDPDVYPPEEQGTEHDHQLVPGPTHFLRRLKEELFDHENEPLFHDRIAANVNVPLSAAEFPFYSEALGLVATYFPQEARTLGRMVYGKRAASCLHSLAETLRRRADGMGTLSSAEAARHSEWGSPDGDDAAAAEHAKVIYAGSTSSPAERAAIKQLLAKIDAHLQDPANTGPADVSAKWSDMVDTCLEPHGISPGSAEQLVVFTEYADTADWLVDQFRHEGYSAERYSGRDDHATRDIVRDRFMAGEFQVIVSTDAGNEGIDLQSAQVLVNWDIPWSLVTLEQRMGRIHRVGQTEDVHLFNLITTGTLEGDTYAKLLERLVSASNELKGKMFDCLSLVGEQVFGAGTTDVPLAKMFSDDVSADRVRTAIDAITAEQLRQAAETELDREKALAAGVDMDEAIRGLQDQQLEQINPYVVERFLRRLDDAELIGLGLSPIADEGLFNLRGADGFGLPRKLLGYGQAMNADGSVLVATLGKAKTDAVKQGNARASSAVDLSPSTEPFRHLVDAAVNKLRPALHRGGVLRDATSTTDYTLFAFETAIQEGRRDRRWRQLVRADDTGAHPVRFDILNNLTALPGRTHTGSYHPGRHHQAVEASQQALDDRRAERETLLDVWHTKAASDLARLPSDLTRDIRDGDKRRAVRLRAQAAAQARTEALKAAADLTVGTTTLVGWAHVEAAGMPEQPTVKDSENIAMLHVANVLSPAGWKVADVHTENVGYDMRARRNILERCIEVKGIWGDVSSTGIRLTGGEMIRAAQLGEAYWLYVVDQCNDGAGRLAAVIRNPAAKLVGLTDDVPVMRVKGSDLLSLPTDPAT